mgnify:CR=1 FL=1
MKIGNSIDQPRTERTAPAGERPRTGAAGGAGAVTSTDSVALSPVSRGLTGLDAEIDTAKVASVRSAIEHGRFRVDTERVAERMIQQSVELLGVKNKG